MKIEGLEDLISFLNIVEDEVLFHHMAYDVAGDPEQASIIQWALR